MPGLVSFVPRLNYVIMILAISGCHIFIFNYYIIGILMKTAHTLICVYGFNFKYLLRLTPTELYDLCFHCILLRTGQDLDTMTT